MEKSADFLTSCCYSYFDLLYIEAKMKISFEKKVPLKLLHLPHENSFRYDISNCLFEATLQKIEEDCHCVPTYFQDTVPDVPVCTGPSLNCMKKLKDEMGSIKHIIDRGKGRFFSKDSGVGLRPPPASEQSELGHSAICKSNHAI